MTMNSALYFLNDLDHYNIRYRESLMNKLSRDYEVKSSGLIDQPLRTVLTFLNPFSNYISSNLKTNLCASFFIWGSGGIIVNGLGRFRGRKAFRLFAGLLFSLNVFKFYAVQNYADYRYFRRFFIFVTYYGSLGVGGLFDPVANVINLVWLLEKKNCSFCLPRSQP